jgi:hypothetical protein
MKLTKGVEKMKIDIHEEIFKMNDVELSSIIESVKLRRNQLHFKNAHSLRIGQRVSFQGRRGITEKGTVRKIKIKYVLVETDRGQRWNVPGSHLTQIKEAVNA